MESMTGIRYQVKTVTLSYTERRFRYK